MGNKTPRSHSRRLPARAPLAFAASALALAAAGCGGGGSSGSGVPTGLAFRVAWEQPSTRGGVPGAASLTAASGAELGFEEEIPPSVNAIRFVLTPPSGEACCVAVLRGSPAFEERRIVLGNVIPGDSTLEVNGYPTSFAPADGVGQTCDTNGAGSACSSVDTLPSFGSGDIEVDVIANTTNIVEVSVHSLPFLLDLDPDDGETADGNPPPISFAVVDANHDIASGVDILVTQGENSSAVEIIDEQDCADGDAELPDCSEGGELEVRGRLIEAIGLETLEPGTANLHIEATNTAPVPRSMESDTTFIVPDTVETTTTSTTTPTSTTSTTQEEPPATFCVAFTVDSNVDLLGVSYIVNYAASDGEFDGTGEDVECFSLIDGGNTLTSFNDDEGTSTLNSAVISAETFSVPQAIAQCFFLQVPPLDLSGISIQVTEATAGDLSPASATVTIAETTCPF
jgi:hypothetical protein